jgi:purine-nucleoside/S-methyl-5'-thioadenosine phosphorylase / adenosine deaminase
MQFETFAPLDRLGFISHAFTLRTTEDSKAGDFQQRVVKSLGYSEFASAGQPHGNAVAVVSSPSSTDDVDALATSTPNLPLLVRCADCAAVFIVDQVTPAIALIHSGKKGTEGRVTTNVLMAMQRAFGTQPQNCLAFIGPSIGPCHYEMDLWSSIEQELRDFAVREIYSPRVCTACHLDRYFSYRAEKGRTGRMLAVLALKPS